MKKFNLFIFSLLAIFIIGIIINDKSYAKPLTLKMAHIYGKNHLYNVGSMKFAELVENNTSGEIKINIFHSGQLCNNSYECLELLKLGSLDIAVVSAQGLSSIPKIELLNLPMIVSDSASIHRFLKGSGRDQIENDFNNIGITALEWFDNGFVDIYSRREITSISDFKGLKIGLTSSKSYSIDFFKNLNSNPIYMNSFSELFTSLDSQSTDAIEISIIGLHNLFDSGSYVTLTGHEFQFASLIMSKRIYDRLSQNHQQALRNSAIQASAFERKERVAIFHSIINNLESRGVNIVEINRSELREIVEPLYKQYTSGNSDLIDWRELIIKVAGGNKSCKREECRCADGKCHKDTDSCCKK